MIHYHCHVDVEGIVTLTPYVNERLLKMPHTSEDFRAFSTAHSWYKHLNTGVRMAIIPMTHLGRRDSGDRPDDGKLHWYMYCAETVLSTVSNLTVRAIVQAHTIVINALVFGRAHGFNHTVSIGGDDWFAWLRGQPHYAVEYNAIKAKSTWTEDGWGGMAWSVDMYNDDPIVVELKRREYQRMLADFKAACRSIWKALVKAGYTRQTLRYSSQQYAEDGARLWQQKQQK